MTSLRSPMVDCQKYRYSSGTKSKIILRRFSSYVNHLLCMTVVAMTLEGRQREAAAGASCFCAADMKMRHKRSVMYQQMIPQGENGAQDEQGDIP